jgi:Guanylate-binding protein, N-terminal domain
VTSDGTIHLNTYVLELISQVKKKLAVISVTGPYRTGKSFLLNRFAGKMHGFQLGNTTNPCTEGLWIWGKPIPINYEMDALLIDSEGLSKLKC